VDIHLVHSKTSLPQYSGREVKNLEEFKIG